MIHKLLTLAIISLLILGCNNEDNTIQPEETSEEVDTTPPVLSIVDLQEELENGIEVATTLNISIQDESNTVSTSVLINAREILKSNQKSFSFEINPFDFPNGENTLSIVSSDSEGNQSEQTQTFEVNKLLVSIAAPLVPSDSQLFFSVNTMDGDLVAFAPVNRPLEIVKLYANDNFTVQPIVVTSYEMQPQSINKASLESIANIQPGTNLVGFQEAAGLRTENTVDTSPYLDNGIVLDITGITTEKLANSLFGAGFNHGATSHNIVSQNSEYTAQLFFRFQQSQTVRNAIIYPSGFFIDPEEEQISIEDYKYLFIQNPSNSTFSFQDFKIPATTEYVNIPSSTTSYLVRTFGFSDNEAFVNNDFRYIYDLNFENINNTVEVPVIDEFQILRNSLLLNLDDRRRLEVSTLGFKDITLPDWTAVRSGNTINMSGELDKFTLSFILGDNPDISMAWSFTDKYTENYEMPFETFVFPDEFINYANEQSLSLVDFNTRGIFRVEQFNSSEPLDYEELLFSIFTYTQLGDVYILRTDL
ncbi:hypothetical protein MTsPCn5_04560 [Croceitalea sp. MTPC5]|uniref:hypothetical protein n=1 Tax=Croceitalea sp. MTPC5 TaxID=3056565 RepID=UPI002B3AF2DB|nr:hypothetical protein MTsPCn5_04560 [Croceitalea sp. MTPC5]